MHDEHTHMKWLPASRLIELLSQLPPETKIHPSRVSGNLVLFNDVGELIAEIDFNFEGTLDYFSA